LSILFLSYHMNEISNIVAFCQKKGMDW
jgi:hypothetical protein